MRDRTGRTRRHHSVKRSGPSLLALGLALLAAPMAASAEAPRQAKPTATPADPGEIIVTATRKEETLSKVPISVSAFNTQKLDKLGVKSFADVVRFTPGISTTTDNTHEIAIRGIASNAGASTTGIYIDDTPIQIRQLGLNSNNAQPIIADLDRIEVLRGPQGTLFGSGSEGGTVRFITPPPSLTTSSLAAHGEVSATEHGSPSYEGSVTVGLPLVQEKLGLRVSVYGRRDGGYINHQDPYSYAVTKDTDWVKSFALRAALAWAPTETITITPSVMIQNRNNNNTDVSGYVVGLSNPAAGQFMEDTPTPMTDHDHFVLGALKMEWRGAAVRLISNTSYFKRHEDVNGYEGTIYNLSYFQHSFDPAAPGYGLDPNYAAAPLNPAFLGQSSPLLTPTGINPQFVREFGAYRSPNLITNTQQNFTQELRLQSDGNTRLGWVLGAFYSSIKQDSDERLIDPALDAVSQYLFGENNFAAWNGYGLIQPGNYGYENHGRGNEWQLAGFIDATYRITDSLKANLGARVARSHFDFSNVTQGAETFADPRISSGGTSETPVTPKFNLSWQVTPQDMVYATVSKGYRVGGANAPLLAACNVPNAPGSFSSDSVWNYELGAKLRMGPLRLSGAVYDIEWSNIQQSVYVTACGQQFVANLGKARSRGFDLEAELRPVRQVTMNLAIGYTHARYTQDSVLPADPATPGSQQLTIGFKGDGIAGPPLTVSGGIQIDFNLGDHPGFIRFDDEYAAHNGARLISTDPGLDANGNNLLSYDPNLVADPATNQASARLGLTLGKADLAVFVNNLFNAHPELDLAHQDQWAALYTANTFRPRSFGMSVNVKY